MRHYHLVRDERVSLHAGKTDIFFSLLEYQCPLEYRVSCGGTYRVVDLNFRRSGGVDYSGADLREGALQPKIGRHHCGIILQLGSIVSEGTRMLPFVI